MNSKELKMENGCFGKMMLVEVRPINYVEGTKVDTPVGHAYIVTLPRHSFDKLTVKIDGPAKMAAPEEGYVEVRFTDLVIRPYVRDGRVAFTATATDVHPVNANKG